MTLPAFDTMDEVLVAALRAIKTTGSRASPRDMPTTEVLGFGFALNNPRARRVWSAVRRWSYALAIGEFCWHCSGSDAVDGIAYYAPAWRQFAADGQRVVGSSYGRKIFSDALGQSQWANLVHLLKVDRDSRRAVLPLFSTDKLDLEASPDVSCTISCQFLIRNHQLHAFVSMRSNDVILGLPYDAFLFTMLQERLALELGVDLGTYNHWAASMHLYDAHVPLAQDILDSPVSRGQAMLPMSCLEDLPQFLHSEALIRASGTLPPQHRLSGYWGELQRSLLRHASRRQKDQLEIVT